MERTKKLKKTAVTDYVSDSSSEGESMGFEERRCRELERLQRIEFVKKRKQAMGGRGYLHTSDNLRNIVNKVKETSMKKKSVIPGGGRQTQSMFGRRKGMGSNFSAKARAMALLAKEKAAMGIGKTKPGAKGYQFTKAGKSRSEQVPVQKVQR